MVFKEGGYILEERRKNNMVYSFKYHRMAEDVDHGKRALICCIRTIITLVKFR